jgi:hypothetical protein
MIKSNYFLTIDVGTKNLAICVCRYNENLSDNTYYNSNKISETNKIADTNILERINILSWDIIDVSYKPLYCKQIKNKRAICNCISKYYSLKENTTDHSNPDNLIGYCKTHVKQIREHNKQKQNRHNQIKIHSINSNPIYKNNFSTQMEKLLEGLEEFFKTKILSPYCYDTTKSKLLTISNLDIYIENQPVFKNPIMKSISVGIYTFFCMKKITNPKIISSINFINATVKTKPDFVLKLNGLIGITSEIKDFKSYSNRKDFSEDIVGQIIHKLTYNREYLGNIVSTSNYALAKKKDDLADTLLYQIYAIMYLL